MPFLRQPAPAANVLVVCSGNVCRSPYLAARLAADLPHLTIASAGTQAVRGAPPADEVIAELAARSIPLVSSDGAQRLTRSRVRGARLIVTAAREHRVEVVRRDRSAAERAFTLKELARVLDGAAGVGLDEAVRLAGAAADDGVDHDDDLADPYGLGADAFAHMVAEADAALTVLVRALAGPLPRPRP